jgi:hypothetical protein
MTWPDSGWKSSKTISRASRSRRTSASSDQLLVCKVAVFVNISQYSKSYGHTYFKVTKYYSDHIFYGTEKEHQNNLHRLPDYLFHEDHFLNHIILQKPDPVQNI